MKTSLAILPAFTLLSATLTWVAFADEPEQQTAPEAEAPEVAEPSEAKKPLKALLITGGCCHEYDLQKQILTAGISDRTPVEWEVVHQGGTTTDTPLPIYDNADWAVGYDVVVHNECFSDVTDPGFVEGILKPHREGTPALVIHCSMHSYRIESDDWFEFCGVTSHRHGAHFPYTVENLQPEDPIMAGFGDLWTTPQGELYHIEKVWPGVTPLAQARRQPEGIADVCVWKHEYGKGRVFGTTIGHHAETMAEPTYIDLITRGLLWATDRLEGANLDAPEKPADKGAQTEPAENLARGKVVLASSEETGKDNLAAKAIDGDHESRWCASGAQSDEWWQVDLGKAEPIKSCRIYWEGASAYRYTIDGSLDGETWTQLVDQSENRDPNPATSDLVDVDETRFLRVTFLGAESGAWGSIREFEAYAGPLPELPKGLTPARSTTLVPAAEEGLLRDVRIPPGYTASLFAAPPEITYPTFIEATPEGPLFVSVDENGSLGRDPNRGRIMLCYDDDQDGKADRFSPFVADLDSPRGLAWDGDWLYVMHPPHLSAFRDTDGDGVADENRRLVDGIAFDLKDRPADHTSNGVTLGIDGWLYLAIGDFGFMKATGTDGNELQLRGGGIVRVRTDGTGLELYSSGTRNIYEAAVDPFLNAFSRDNTNDGGGWDVRLHHFTGLEQHGYPSLYINFNEEIVQPLADYGGGSGTGAHYLFEPGFPSYDGNSLYTVDWGRSRIFRHELERDGATFREVAQHEFTHLDRATDMDVDGSSRLYLASWKNGGYSYSTDDVGFIVQLKPTRFSPRPFPDLKQSTVPELAAILEWPSATAQLAAQREILRRSPAALLEVEALARNTGAPRASRVAAVFTLKQALSTNAHPVLSELTSDPSIGALAVRALADDRANAASVNPAIWEMALASSDSRTRLEGILAVARSGNTDLATHLLPLSNSSDPVITHTAVKAMISLDAAEACLAWIDRTDVEPTGAFLALQAMHRPNVVEGLIERLPDSESEKRRGLLKTLARLAHREGKWEAESWGTRPDTSGPYYKRTTWEETDQITSVLKNALESWPTERAFLLGELSRNQFDLNDSLPLILTSAAADPAVEPAAVATVLKGPDTPDAALGLLTSIAQNKSRPNELRIEAATALARSANDDAVATAFDVLLADLTVDTRSLVRAFVANETHENRYEWLIEQVRHEGKRYEIAWDALLTLMNRKPLAPETRGEIVSTVYSVLAEAETAIPFLEAVEELRQQHATEFVFAALDHADGAVKAAAEKAAEALGLRHGDNIPDGPPIAEIEPREVLREVMRIKGDPKTGEALFTRQTCNICHTVKPDEALKGPYLGNITSIYRRRDLAQAILDPAASIAQGFATNVITTSDGTTVAGFITREGADEIELRDVAGNVTVIKPDTITERIHTEISMMPPGLAHALTVSEFASLLAYLEGLE